MSTEDLSKIKMEEITLNNSNIARIGLEVDSFKNLNKPLCSMSKLFDRGYESYLSQGKIRKFKPPENFTGIFKLGDKIKKMTSLEFHCYHNHIGYHPDCRICNLTARSLKRTFVDRVIYHEIRVGYRFTMDAFVVSHRSDRGRKYAYTYIDMGPSGYFEGFTLRTVHSR